MSVIKYLQLPFHFDVIKMQQEVAQLASAHWQLHYQTLQYDGEWSAIPLRSSNGKADNIIISPFPGMKYKDTGLLANDSYISEVLTTFQCELMAVRLLKLNAGATIKEHSDADLNFENGEVRIHIPVATNDNVEFYLDKERLDLKEGECWYMNFNLPHHISNNSDQDRIHLVIDAMVNDWVKELFTSDTILAKKKIAITKPGYDLATKKQMIARFREMNTPKGNELADALEKELSG